MLKPLFHLSVVAINSYVLWYDQTHVDLPMARSKVGEMPFKARSIFLTSWCLLVQTVYHFIAFLSDILEEDSPKKRRILHRIRDAFFSIAFPLALYVSSAFWCVFWIDRELILPKEVDNLYPPFCNHIMHTTVALFMFVELFISYRKYPKRMNGTFAITIIILLYTALFFYVYTTYKVWVYPFFAHINWPSRILFIIFSIISGPVLYIFGELLNQLVSPSPNKKTGTFVSNGKAKHS